MMLKVGTGKTERGYRWKERRLAILRTNPEILGMLCLQSAQYTVISGLPEDARCLGAHIDVNSGDIFLKIESEEYEPVQQGNQVPFLDANLLIIKQATIDYKPEGYDTDKDISEIMDKPCVTR